MPGWDQFVALIMQGLTLINGAIGNQPALAIIIFTALIKLAMFPLTNKQLHSSKRMQELQPEIRELQKKYAKDKQKLTQETMALYKAHDASPTSGCLPMLVQMPVFFGLYSAIIQLAHTSFGVPFLWLPSLAAPDPYFILAILAGVFQFIQQRMMMPSKANPNRDSTQATTNMMMQFMPLMIVVFAWQFASGAVIYWIVSSIFGIIQQYFVTGWGSLSDLLPFLPQPKHQRESIMFTNKPIEGRKLQPRRVIETSAGEVAEQKPARGFMGLLEKLADAQADAQSRMDAAKELRESSDGEDEPVEGAELTQEEAEEEAIAEARRQASGRRTSRKKRSKR